MSYPTTWHRKGWDDLWRSDITPTGNLSLLSLHFNGKSKVRWTPIFLSCEGGLRVDKNKQKCRIILISPASKSDYHLLAKHFNFLLLNQGYFLHFLSSFFSILCLKLKRKQNKTERGMIKWVNQNHSLFTTMFIWKEKKKNTTVESICYAGFFTEIRQCPQVPSSPSPNVPSCHKDKIARKRPLSHGIMAVICIVHPESHRKGDRTANAAAAHACQGSLPALLNSHFAHLSWATGGPAQNSVLDYSVSIDQCWSFICI